MVEVTDPERSPAMTGSKGGAALVTGKDLLTANPDGLREIVRAVLQEALEAEMSEAPAAEKGERAPARLGGRAGSCTATLVTRVGKLELTRPQGREG
jgi:putative transposase